MGRQAILRVSEGRREEALKILLRRFLEKGVVEAILVPKRLPSGEGVVQSLIRDPAMMDGISLLSPTMPVQSARVASYLSIKNLSKKVALILKACEIRAIVELSKFLQVKLDPLFLIGVDCPGTFEVSDYAKMVEEGKDGFEEVIRGMEKGEEKPPEGFRFRKACEICEYPVTQGDLWIQLYGYASDKEIGLEIGERLEREMKEKGVELEEAEGSKQRGEVLRQVIERRSRKRDETFQEFRAKVKDLGAFLDLFSTCVRCHNCMVACPICYCKECVFRTAIFEHEGDQFLRWADRKGAIRMPTDTLIFHLIRMSHMVTSCIGCGLCESACPSRLPVAILFRTVGEKIQKLFDYVPGREVNEPPPVATFKEEELKIESGAI